MALERKERRELRPAAPEPAVQELLTVPLVRQLPLETGGIQECAEASAEYHLIAAVRGSLTVSSHQQYTLLDTGQALALHCAGPYVLQAVSECLCMTVSLRGELAGRLLSPRLSGSSALFRSGAAPVRELVLALLVLEESHAPVDGAAASAQAYALLMKLPAAQGDAAPLSPLVASAIAIIQEEFPYLEGLEELSQRLEVSKAHLIRSFVKKTGISPGKYLTQVRIAYAKLLLQDPDSTVTYVAEASGFANANYFAKVFRRETGMSPSEYLESVPRQAHVPLPRQPFLW